MYVRVHVEARRKILTGVEYHNSVGCDENAPRARKRPGYYEEGPHAHSKSQAHKPLMR
jgi:hypothetical protein